MGKFALGRDVYLLFNVRKLKIMAYLLKMITHHLEIMKLEPIWSIKIVSLCILNYLSLKNLTNLTQDQVIILLLVH
jgi:hypothetical protein